MSGMRKPLSVKKLNAAMDTPAVRAAARAKAERILPRARAIALTAGATAFAEQLKIAEGVRSGGKSPSGLERSYARVVADMPDKLRSRDFNAKLTRRQILRRASNA
ncbi:hypothetical protein [Zhihengliuella halotolerans]|uniref:Uncharacterized protein n=1 Tax=Zhihengliuella halotolerans TaxID=370736 RepID=A0A4Q8ADA8_9MICC|nr:hypothetical protein [Zhihengliuella halotolerans]RZU61741.1 hypothetical protein EV380_1319 [Zhihengliuella halotolerans]